ncbi:MAG: FMN-binding protein, partial [Clostridia bacterium]|nr:FMN-binding protein [Clostridia bacterium]
MYNKEVSRRSFLKGMTAGAMGVAASAVLPGIQMAGAEGIYKPGTYSAKASGIVSDVTVTMTFDENAITDVSIDVSGETPEIGGAIGDTMKDAILASQSAELDVVSGASVTSRAVQEAAANCIAQAKGEAVITNVAIEEDAQMAFRPEKGEGFPSDYGSFRNGAQPIPPEEVPASWDEEYDVIVVGSGIGGLTAALYT